MATKKATKGKWSPPRGIRYRDYPDRSKPFYLFWKNPETKEEEFEKFETEAARELAAKSLAEARAEHGTEMLRFDPREWRRWLEFKDRIGKNVDPIEFAVRWVKFQEELGEGIDPMVVAHEWKATQQGKPAATGLSVVDAIAKYVELRDGEKSWGADSRRHAKKHLQRFSDEFGTHKLYEVSTDQIRNWLGGLEDDDGAKIGPHGQKDHRKNVSTFFTYALREKWGARENPVLPIKPPKTEDGDPTVIPIRDAFEYFKANCDDRIAGRVAMEAFGGIRYTTASKIEKEAINFSARGIRMSANIHKSGLKDGRSRYRQGHPDNLWLWLSHAPESCWEMTPLNYREAKRYAWIRAKLRPAEILTPEDKAKVESLDNVWRHSFVSYHLARYKSVPLTQYLAQHQSPRQTQEYEGLADETDAARFFMITPEKVLLSWEQFIGLPIPKLNLGLSAPGSTE